MKNVFTALVAVTALVLLAAPATAHWDWEDGWKMHYPQEPDLQFGLDVLATGWDPHKKVLADDFECTETGQITDIHVWGSWLGDVYPVIDDPHGTLTPSPGNVAFRLSLHKNITADENTQGEFSMPGEEIWAEWFGPAQFKWQHWATVDDEGFYDPNRGYVVGFDNNVFQYNFYPRDPPDQVAGEIYWLDLSAYPKALGLNEEEPLFGWKTTPFDLHFMDDAVFGHMQPGAAGDVPVGDWQPLTYPDGHKYQGETMDLAFVITPEPSTVMMLVGAGLMGLLAFARYRRKR